MGSFLWVHVRYNIEPHESVLKHPRVLFGRGGGIAAEHGTWGHPTPLELNRVPLFPFESSTGNRLWPKGGSRISGLQVP